MNLKTILKEREPPKFRIDTFKNKINQYLMRLTGKNERRHRKPNLGIKRAHIIINFIPIYLKF